jgi:GT2 family glycosyltransferase
MLRITERSASVSHVGEVLVHRRVDEEVYRGAGSGLHIERALERRGESAVVEPDARYPNSWTIRRQSPGAVKISVVIPFRDGATYLRTVVDSITATAAGADIELLLVDNGSAEPETQTLVEELSARRDVVVLPDARPFNWAALNNAAVQRATGNVLLFLNNDIEALKEGWLQALAASALRSDVAAVGARLLFPDGRVQHAGVVIGLGGAAGHALWGLAGDEPGYLGMAVLPRECSAVTGACMATRIEVFAELQGFDENLGVDLNDVDYCLRAIHRGYRVLFEPGAELTHYESPTRGTSGSVPNVRRFVDHWIDDLLAGDRYLNRNLTRVDSSCALRGDDEDGWWQEWRTTLNSM